MRAGTPAGLRTCQHWQTSAPSALQPAFTWSKSAANVTEQRQYCRGARSRRSATSPGRGLPFEAFSDP